MKKVDLNDVCIIIPVTLDSISRLENLVCIVNFISDNFEVEIQLLETAPYPNYIIQKLLQGKINYHFFPSSDVIFHRTKFINNLVSKTNKNIVGVWDSDVLCHPNQIVESINLLKEDKVDYVYPYSDRFLDTSKIIRELYFEKLDLNILLMLQGKMKEIYAPKPVGGAFFINKQKYISAGLENEEFYGWGVEDGERATRFSILGLKRGRVVGPLFHLTHDRGINSQFHSIQQDVSKRNILFSIGTMSEMELKNFINK